MPNIQETLQRYKQISLEKNMIEEKYPCLMLDLDKKYNETPLYIQNK